MATRFLADSTTQTRLGAEVLAELRATLWAKLLLLTDDTVVFLVNPYYEYAVLQWDGGGWTVATLDRFETYGMGPNLLDGVFTQPSLSIVVGENPLPGLIAARQVRLGAVRITYTERAQSLRCAHGGDSLITRLPGKDKLGGGADARRPPGAGPATSSTVIPESPSSRNLPLGWSRPRPIQCHGRRPCREEQS